MLFPGPGFLSLLLRVIKPSQRESCPRAGTGDGKSRQGLWEELGGEKVFSIPQQLQLQRDGNRWDLRNQWGRHGL